MANNRRINRMNRTKGRKVPGLSLISLMDVFTILVFFLLVNQADTKDLPSPDDIDLPESITQIAPTKNIVIMINRDRDILVNNEFVLSVDDLAKNNKPIVSEIISLLDEEKKKIEDASKVLGKQKVSVTIMSDKDIEFSILKRVMSTCTIAGYEEISLAVLQSGEGET